MECRLVGGISSQLVWEEFLPNWSGTSLIFDTHWTPSSDLQLYTDASGKDGRGAFWNDR